MLLTLCMVGAQTRSLWQSEQRFHTHTKCYLYCHACLFLHVVPLTNARQLQDCDVNKRLGKSYIPTPTTWLFVSEYIWLPVPLKGCLIEVTTSYHISITCLLWYSIKANILNPDLSVLIKLKRFFIFHSKSHTSRLNTKHPMDRKKLYANRRNQYTNYSAEFALWWYAAAFL